MAAAARGRTRRVLIVEPHREVRAFLVRLVGYLGYVPVLPRGGEEAEYDLLLVDAESESGLAVARTLREADPGLPIVVTGTFPPGDDALALEPAGVLVKPFTLAECELALGRAATLAAAPLRAARVP